MPSNVAYTVDGIALDSPQGYWYLLDEKAMGSNLKRRNVATEIPGKDGFLPSYDETENSVMIGFRMVCNSVGVRTVADSYEAVMSLFRKRTGPVIVQRTLFGATHAAEMKYVETVNTKPIETYDSIEFVVVMEIPGGFWRDAADLTWSQVPVSGTSYRASPFDNSSSDIRDAKIKLTGPMTNPVVRDMGSTMEFSMATIVAGRQVIVDVATGYAYEAAASTSWALTGNDWTQFLRTSGPGSGRRIFTMTPTITASDPFDRRINIRVTSSGMTGSSKIEIQGRRCFS